jgi:hypothetical protein
MPWCYILVHPSHSFACPFDYLTIVFWFRHCVSIPLSFTMATEKETMKSQVDVGNKNEFAVSHHSDGSETAGGVGVQDGKVTRQSILAIIVRLIVVR